MNQFPSDSLQRAAIRGLRVFVAMFIMGAIAYFSSREELLMLAPALNALGKYLRERFDVPFMPV